MDPADGKRGLVAAVRADCMPVADNLPGASLYLFRVTTAAAGADRASATQCEIGNSGWPPHGAALKIRIAAPAADGNANAALIDFLHQWFNLPWGNVIIKRGTSSRRKIVEIANPSTDVMTILRNMTP